MNCPVCDKEITYECGIKPTTCSKSCAAKYVKPGTVYTCKACGDKFVPSVPGQKYCGKAVESTCVVCGKKMVNRCGDEHVVRIVS